MITYYFKLISITSVMNYDLSTKIESWLNKKRKYVVPVHKNTKLNIFPK